MRIIKRKGASPFFRNISKQTGGFAEIEYKNLLEDLTPYTLVTVKGVRTVQEIISTA